MSFQHLKGHIRFATQTCHGSLTPVWFPFHTCVAVHWFLLNSPSPGLPPARTLVQLINRWTSFIPAMNWSRSVGMQALIQVPDPSEQGPGRASHHIMERTLIHREQSFNGIQAHLTANHLLAHISPADPWGEKGGFSDVLLKTRHIMSISYPTPWR